MYMVLCSKYPFIFLLIYVFVCVSMCHGMHTDIGGQLVKVISPLQLGGSQGLNSLTVLAASALTH